MNIKTRELNQKVFAECLENGFPEITARILAGRTDVFDPAIIDPGPACVVPAMTMADCPKAAERIAKAIQEDQKILLFTDYDVDGCTSMAILFRALNDGFKVPERQIIQLVGHRTKDGYGITDTVADKVSKKGAGFHKSRAAGMLAAGPLWQDGQCGHPGLPDRAPG